MSELYTGSPGESEPTNQARQYRTMHTIQFGFPAGETPITNPVTVVRPPQFNLALQTTLKKYGQAAKKKNSYSHSATGMSSMSVRNRAGRDSIKKVMLSEA